MIYDKNLSKFKNLTNFYKNLKSVDKCSVFSVLRELYCNHKFSKLVVEDGDLELWWPLKTFLIIDKFNLEVVLKEDTFTISKQMCDVLNTFKTEFIPHVTLEEFESFALPKIFLEYYREENVKKILLCVLNFDNFRTFLSAVECLYEQKFNASKIKQLFSRILFADVYDYTSDEVIRHDIISILSNKHSNTEVKIELKRLKPHTQYINNYNVELAFDQMFTKLMNHYKTNESIMPLTEFLKHCIEFKNMSNAAKTVKLLKEAMKSSTMDAFINNLNPLYANIVILALFKIRERDSSHNNTLYSDLKNLHSALVKCL
ncbi:hypothetical protein PvNV_064 [Penaeus vannamei nudivirus]|nr:hypothetical protein PvSNPV_064 [Penaeus vannamei nucleopolyhedrovirus]